MEAESSYQLVKIGRHDPFPKLRSSFDEKRNKLIITLTDENGLVHADPSQISSLLLLLSFKYTPSHTPSSSTIYQFYLTVPWPLSTILTFGLIPKTPNPISKILVNCLRPLLHHCISPNQGAFVTGHSIFDNILIAHEMFFLFNKSKNRSGFLALKLDFKEGL